MKILIPVDGSDTSLKATRQAIALAKGLAKTPKLVLMHADLPLMRRVAAELGTEGTRRYHAENHEFALKSARTALRRAKLDFTEKTVLEDAPTAITDEAKQGKYGLVVMGSHGRTALARVLMGSVTARVLSQSEVPVLVVR